MTYNQDKYIEACLESIVTQETDFTFEVIVGDDCSTDRTAEIVRVYSQRYPGKVIPVLHQTRSGVTANYLSVHSLARGEYVAHIDGDDLMLPGKIQIQGEYLKNHPELVAVWHRVKTITEDCWISEPAPSSAIVPVSQQSVLERGSAGHHSSLMYRREKKPNLETSKRDILDLHISVELLGGGSGAILPDVLGVYRKGVGIMTTNRPHITRLVKEYLDHYLTVYPQFRVEINRLAFSLFVLELAAGHREARLILDTFLKSLNVKTPLSVAVESGILVRKAIAKLFQRKP